MNGTQITMVSQERMYCGMPKGTSQAEAQAEAMSNSEKIKPVALAII